MTRQQRQDALTTTTARLARVKLVRLTGEHPSLRQLDKHSSLPDTSEHERTTGHQVDIFSSRFTVPGSVPPSMAMQVLPDTDHHQPIFAYHGAAVPLPKSPQIAGKKAFWQSSTVRIAAGFLVGLFLFALVLYYVNPAAIFHMVQRNLTTTRGVLFVLCASLSFVLAFCFRALRWRLFLNPVRQVSQVKVIQIFLVGVFLNFVLPIRIGELAKCLILKRSDNIDVRQSLPTITMDKVQDLLPALLVVAVAPLLGERFDARLWTVLTFAVSVLLGAIFFVVLTAWKRNLALGLLHKLSRLLPGTLGTKVEGFATGFVEALLACTRQPKVFLLAILLTAISVSCDGLYNMFGFWTIGYSISFGQAVFGYLLFNLFYILPNPPGQMGSNEVVGLLIFSGLLSIPPQVVLAEIVLYHAWSALLMCLMGMGSLSALGISFSHAIKLRSDPT